MWKRLTLSRRPSVRISMLYWMTVAGIGVWGIIAASGIIPGAAPVQAVPFFLIVALAAINLAFRTGDRVKRERRQNARRSAAYGWVFVTCDLILITVGLRFSGGLESPLWVVLFLVGLAETVLASSEEANLIRYGSILALILGTLPLPVTAINGRYFLEIAVRVGAFFAVQSVVRKLREGHDAQERENAALRAELGLAQERSHLSREVHDGVGNSLAAAVLRLEVAARTLDKRNPDDETAPLLRDEAQALREAMSAVRDWTFFTRPWTMPEGQASSAVLVGEIERLSRRTGLAMTTDGAAELDSAPSVLRLTVSRIVQEGLTNAAKHAKDATRAEVRLRRDGDHLLLTIADDGAGFDTAVASCGVGFSSMQERAKGAGGTFHADSSPGLGTTLTVRLPLQSHLFT